ncbi:MAG: putative aminohydrolase SsnA [Acidobacteriota bacterium]
MKRLLIKNGTVVTLGNPNRVLPNHAVLIENGRIKKVLPQESVRGMKAQVIEAGGKVVLPGFINCHMHFYSSFARGLTGVKPSRSFPENLRNLWWRLDRLLSPEDCYYSTLVAGLEAIRHGTTTVIDHHSSPGAVAGSLGRIAGAVRELGLRACLCYEVSDRDGRSIAREGIQENLRFLEECRQSGDNRLKALFGLHASFTLEESTLRSCARAAEKYEAGFHIHCAEDRVDQVVSLRKFGRRVVPRLAGHGILGPRTICAHGVHLHDREWDVLARTKTAVVHNPQSNSNNGVGVMDLLKALKKGVLVGLGSDAMTLNMLEELRSAIWTQRLFHRNPGVAFDEAVDLLMTNNQEICNRYFEGLGQIKEGWMADLICIDYSPATAMNEENFPAHMTFGLSQAPVDTTIVGGTVLMKNRKLLLLDEEKIGRDSRRASSKLWRRFGSRG